MLLCTLRNSALLHKCHWSVFTLTNQTIKYFNAVICSARRHEDICDRRIFSSVFNLQFNIPLQFATTQTRPHRHVQSVRSTIYIYSAFLHMEATFIPGQGRTKASNFSRYSGVILAQRSYFITPQIMSCKQLQTMQ